MVAGCKLVNINLIILNIIRMDCKLNVLACPYMSCSYTTASVIHELFGSSGSINIFSEIVLWILI